LIGRKLKAMLDKELRQIREVIEITSDAGSVLIIFTAGAGISEVKFLSKL
jgi:hypothetical protein